MVKDSVASNRVKGLRRGGRSGAGEGRVSEYGRFLELPPMGEQLKPYHDEPIRRSRHRSRSSPVRLRSEAVPESTADGSVDKRLRHSRSPSVSPSLRPRGELPPQNITWGPPSASPLLMILPLSLAYTSPLSYYSGTPPTQPVSFVALPPNPRQTRDVTSSTTRPAAHAPVKRSRSARRATRYALRVLIDSLPLSSSHGSLPKVTLKEDCVQKNVNLGSNKQQSNGESGADDVLSGADNCGKQLVSEEKHVCPQCNRCADELSATQMRLLLRHLRQVAHIDRLHKELRRAAR